MNKTEMAMKLAKKTDISQGKAAEVIDEEEAEARRAVWVAPESRYPTGALGKYAKLVGTAEHGAVCD